VNAAGFRELKPLTDFEWSFNPSIKKKQVYDLACCRFSGVVSRRVLQLLEYSIRSYLDKDTPDCETHDAF
jgi:hypothetical protein